MRRCRETAAPLSAIWGVEPIVEPRIAEVPGPPASALSREEWLRRALIAEWPELIALGKTLQARYDCTLTSWRAGVLEAVLACPLFETAGDEIRLVERGRESKSKVN
jgi:hypothetical protein